MLPEVVGTCFTSGSSVSAAVAATLNFLAASQCLITEPWPKQASVQNGARFDFIIVGGGTAGSTLAARLAEMPHFSVLLVEAGGDPPQESIIPGFRDSMKNSAYDWNFTTVEDQLSSYAFIGGSQKQPRGKMLGGSGSINDMVYSRGNPVDYDEWATIAGEEWSWKNVLEYFKKSEHMTDENIVDNCKLMRMHGRDGEIEVTGSKHSTHITSMFLKSFGELGFDIVNDMTDPTVIGAGRFSHTVNNGRRDSSLTALLNKAASKRDNLFVLKDSVVTKVLVKNNTAYGVKILQDNKIIHYFANKEIIVSAGTFNTAKLLLLSGIGPRAHLEEMGINVIQDLPVGDNLHDHVMVNTFMAADRGTCHTIEINKHMNMMQYLYDRSGPLSYSDSMGAYISSNNSNIPEFAIYPTCIEAGTDFYKGCGTVLGFKPYICKKLKEENLHHDLLPLAVVHLKPESRGKVRLASNEPVDSPLIYSGTFSSLEDLEGFPEAIATAWSLTKTSYFSSKKAYIVDISIDECDEHLGELGELEKMRCLVKSLATSAWHAVGTASMGTVVDARLKVKGVRRLRVVDASVIPKVPRGNTNAPVVMIAEKAADFIKEKYN